MKGVRGLYFIESRLRLSQRKFYLALRLSMFSAASHFDLGSALNIILPLNYSLIKTKVLHQSRERVTIPQGKLRKSVPRKQKINSPNVRAHAARNSYLIVGVFYTFKNKKVYFLYSRTSRSINWFRFLVELPKKRKILYLIIITHSFQNSIY